MGHYDEQREPSTGRLLLDLVASAVTAVVGMSLILMAMFGTVTHSWLPGNSPAVVAAFAGCLLIWRAFAR